jgi:hypothetical protein
VIERIAKAINPVAWLVESHLEQREESLRAAERVISAIEYPTEHMIAAGWTTSEEPQFVWRAMVKAIKKPPRRAA